MLSSGFGGIGIWPPNLFREDPIGTLVASACAFTPTRQHHASIKQDLRRELSRTSSRGINVQRLGAKPWP